MLKALAARSSVTAMAREYRAVIATPHGRTCGSGRGDWKRWRAGRGLHHLVTSEMGVAPVLLAYLDDGARVLGEQCPQLNPR